MSEQSPERFHAEQIAALNDAFRHAGPTEDWLITIGIQGLSDIPGLIQAVRDYGGFTLDDDPHGERDFGVIEWENERTLWKIDYFDQSLQYWADPLSDECHRVMTLLLSEEY